MSRFGKPAKGRFSDLEDISEVSHGFECDEISANDEEIAILKEQIETLKQELNHQQQITDEYVQELNYSNQELLLLNKELFEFYSSETKSENKSFFETDVEGGINSELLFNKLLANIAEIKNILEKLEQTQKLETNEAIRADEGIDRQEIQKDKIGKSRSVIQGNISEIHRLKAQQLQIRFQQLKAQFHEQGAKFVQSKATFMRWKSRELDLPEEVKVNSSAPRDT